ncbi:hypothetical protein [Sphingorhabdus lacus]|uniref:Uncharacterized protein n=1 Tax=Sphingorhabdus lacus TaxID=392610 RepID=A0A6I6L519_9SPHN|nr:hypothetical protein [Sphingorhabdus lacus]QGY81280.1 hypothetical protein EUU25_12040 [Sphingorhabdus lacus]
MDEAQTLPKHHPAVAKLLDTLAAVDADETAVEKALSDAIRALQALDVRPQQQATIVAQKTKLGFSPADRVARLSQDRNVLARLLSVIQAELVLIETQLTEAEVNFRSWALSQPRVDQYKIDFFTKLEAAGFDARAARNISLGDIQKFMEPFSERRTSSEGVRVQSFRPVKKQQPEVALAWHPGNPWIAILENSKHFGFRPHPVLSSQECLKWQRCGLPPFTSLEEYDRPSLYKEFANAGSPKAKANACWKLCEDWLLSTISHDAEAHAARRNAWTLLFAMRYGFDAELDFDSALLPSPFAKASVVKVQRI